MFRVLGFGDNVCDKYLHTGVIYPGGNALNIAVFAKFHGAEAAYLGTFGDDEVGKHVYSTAQKLGIDLSHCRIEKGENGLARVLLVSGDRVFLRGNSGGISRIKPPKLTAIDLDYVASFDLVHTSIFSYIESELPVLRQTAKFISMDFSDRYTDEYLQLCCPFVDCAEISCGGMNEDEIYFLINKIISYGCKQMVIATRGNKGAIVFIDGKSYKQSPCLIEAIDTMGAGDSFITSFLVDYLQGVSVATDFNDKSGKDGITRADDYLDSLIKISLYRAAVFSAEQCQRDGSFGYGKTSALTDEDHFIMDGFIKKK